MAFDYSLYSNVDIKVGIQNAMQVDGKVFIDVWPPDENNRAGGATILDLLYREGTTVTLNAPLTFQGYNFHRWQIEKDNGVSYTSENPLDIVITSDTFVRAYYQGDYLSEHVGYIVGIVSPPDHIFDSLQQSASYVIGIVSPAENIFDSFGEDTSIITGLISPDNSQFSIQATADITIL